MVAPSGARSELLASLFNALGGYETGYLGLGLRFPESPIWLSLGIYRRDISVYSKHMYM